MEDLVKYLKELNTGRDVVWDERGFAIYEIIDDECYIVDIYVKPEHRKGQTSYDLANKVVEIAKENKCTYLTGSVVPSAQNSTVSLKMMLGYGFNLHSSKDNFIVFIKELK